MSLSTAGNYSQGFGKLKPQQEHDLKSGKITNDDLSKFKISSPTGAAMEAAEATNLSSSQGMTSNMITWRESSE